MLYRKAYKKLLDWKTNDSKRALLVDGARQIGKTTLIEEFARREYDDYLKVDFLNDANAGFLSQAADSHDLGSVRELLMDISRLYRADISKYAGSRMLQVMAIYDAMPSQLDKENKRFELRALKGKATFERYANDFAWLVAAGAALKTVNVAEPKCPLARTEEPNRFKLYQGDTGMLLARYPLSAAMAVISGSKDVNFGGVYENVVAQELASARVPLRYYRRSGVGEVDFLAEDARRSVVPIEVKSGKTYKRHVALNNLLSSPEYSIAGAYVLSEANISVEERKQAPICYLPLYLLPFLVRTLVAEDLDAHEELRRMGVGDEALRVEPPDFSDFA